MVFAYFGCFVYFYKIFTTWLPYFEVDNRIFGWLTINILKKTFKQWIIMNDKSKLIQWLKSVLFLMFVDCCVFITFKLEEIFEWKWKCELVTLSISKLSILNFAVHVENVFWASFNVSCQKCLCILFHSFESRSRLKRSSL